MNSGTAWLRLRQGYYRLKRKRDENPESEMLVPLCHTVKIRDAIPGNNKVVPPQWCYRSLCASRLFVWNPCDVQFDHVTWRSYFDQDVA